MWRHWSCLCYCQNRPVGDPRGPHGRPGARGHHVGDPCFIMSKTYSLLTSFTFRESIKPSRTPQSLLRHTLWGNPSPVYDQIFWFSRFQLELMRRRWTYYWNEPSQWLFWIKVIRQRHCSCWTQPRLCWALCKSPLHREETISLSIVCREWNKPWWMW